MNPIALMLQQYGNQLLQPAGDVVEFPGNPRVSGQMGAPAPIVGTIWPQMPPGLKHPETNKYWTAHEKQRLGIRP